MKKALLLLTGALIVLLTACGNSQKESEAYTPATQPATASSTATQETTKQTAESVPTQQQTTATVSTEAPQEKNAPTDRPKEEKNMTLRMTIGGEPVSVTWENNETVEALKELCQSQPLTISMSMYGGFEQVGSIGTNLPANDIQTTTSAGDIVLYSGNQLVVFYGSNTWAYTRLGHITDQSTDDMSQLLSNGDTTITINLE